MSERERTFWRWVYRAELVALYGWLASLLTLDAMLALAYLLCYAAFVMSVAVSSFVRERQLERRTRRLTWA